MTRLIIFSLLIISLWSCNNDKNVILRTEPDSAIVIYNGKHQGNTPLELKISGKINDIMLTLNTVQTDTSIYPTTPYKLKAAYMPITVNLPLYVAIEKGYFKLNGIEIQAFEATSPNDIVTGLVAGKIDFAAALAYSILFPASIQYPGQFKLYSSAEENLAHYTSSIIVKKDSKIKKIEDLKGKKIGIYSGIVQRIFLEAMLIGMKIDPKQVTIIEISPRLQIQGLLSNQYDALSSTEPTTNIAIEGGLARPVVENPRVKYILSPFPSTAATLSTRFLNENPVAASRVIRSLDMAINFINRNPDEAKKILPKYTPIPEENREKIIKSITLFKYCKMGSENRLNVQRFADLLYNYKLLNKKIEDVNLLFGDYENPLGK